MTVLAVVERELQMTIAMCVAEAVNIHVLYVADADMCMKNSKESRRADILCTVTSCTFRAYFIMHWGIKKDENPKM